MFKTKIFVTYKNKNQLLKSDVITPIQTGRALSDDAFDGMLGDDTGDNISFLNECFCEMSAIYWVWKNQDKIDNPNNIGFMHYRRHFLFGEKDYKQNFYGLVKLGEITPEYLATDLTSDENISKVCDSYDAIIPQRIDITTLGKENTNYEQYEKHHDINDYKKAIKIISEKYPEYMGTVEKYNSSKYAYFLNMFVFKKEIFNEYCEWLFDILFDLYDVIDRNKKDSYQQRTIGFIAERLTAIFIYRLLDKNLKIKELPVSFVDTVLPKEPVKENVIPIAVSSSNEYVPILSTCLESIKSTAGENFIYEINVLERNISLRNKRKLREQFANSQIILKYINVEEKLSGLSDYVGVYHYSVDTLSRFFISNLLNYDKCIYLDLDTIVLDDLKKLYDIELGENYLGATRDVIFLALCGCNKKIGQYAKDVLKLDCFENYFQAGVLLMNLKKMREDNFESLCLDTLRTLPVEFADQCVFNYLLKDKIKYIDMKWNYQVYDSMRQEEGLKNYLPIKLLMNYIQAFKQPKIIHFSGPLKPWLDSSEEYAEIWWNFAQKTPFYMQCISYMAKSSVKKECDESTNYKLWVISNFKKNCINYWKCKVLEKLSHGKKRLHYNNKKKTLKQRISQAKEIM